MASLKRQILEAFWKAVTRQVEKEVQAILGGRRDQKTQRQKKAEAVPPRAPKAEKSSSKRVPTASRVLSENARKVLAFVKANPDGIETGELMERFDLKVKGLSRIKNSLSAIFPGKEIVSIEGTGETAEWTPGKDIALALEP